MTITSVGAQAGGATVDNNANAPRAFGSNVAVGNLVVVLCWKDSGNAFVVGDCTKSAGTATLGTITLDNQFRFDTGSSNFVSVGIWSAIVTGAGSCTMNVAGAAGTFWGIATDELNSTIGWDASRVEQAPAGIGNATDNVTSVTTGNGVSAGAAAFMAVMNLPGSGSNTITPDAAFTQIFEQEDDSLHQAGSAIRRIVSAGTTDAGDWTIASPVNVGSAAILVVYREIATSAGARAPDSQITLNPGGIPMGLLALAPGKAPNLGPVPWQDWESYPWSPASAAVIDIASAGALTITGAGSLTAIGTVAAAGAVTITGAAPLTATGTVAAAGALVITGSAALTSLGTLASAGTAVIVGAAAPTAQGTLAAAGAVVITGSAGLTSVGTLASAGTAVINGASDLTAASANDISATGSIVITSSTALSAVGALAASGLLTLAGLARLDDGAMVATAEAPTGGGWPIFAVRYEQELARRRRKKREQEASEQEAREIKDQLDREIALLLRKQEAKDAKRDDLARVRALADQLSEAEAEVQYGQRVAKALERAKLQGNFSAMEALDREIQRARADEEWFLTAVMLLIEDNNG